MSERMPGARKAFWAIVGTVGAAVWLYVFPPPAMVAVATSVGSWLAGAVSTMWRAVWYPIPVPAWLVVVVVVAAVARVWSAWRRSSPTTAAPATTVEVGPQERQMIEVLAAADGDWLSLDILASTLGWRRLEAEHIAEKLYGRAYLLDNRAPSGTLLRLSPSGRDFALANHLMGSAEVVRRLRMAAQEHSNDWMRL